MHRLGLTFTHCKNRIHSDVLGDGRIYHKDKSNIPQRIVGYTTKQFGNGIHTSMYKVRTHAHARKTIKRYI